MNKLVTVIFLLFTQIVFGQSPYLGIDIKMDSVARESKNYRISMKICEPLQKTERGDWFKPDTSTIDFLKLAVADVKCGEYSYIEGTDAYAGSQAKFNEYEFGNQIFAWEKILVFRISDYSSRGWNPEMYVVLPIQYKAFITHIELTGVVYQSGKVIYLDRPALTYKDSRLIIRYSIGHEEAIGLKWFPLKEALKME